MSKIPPQLKEISKQIESQYSQKSARGQKIPKRVLDKYLKIGNKKCFDTFDQIVNKIKPVWSISLKQMAQNIKGVASSQWPFSQQNKSIYLAVWGPLSLVFFCYLFHNLPYENNHKVASAGLIDFGLILLSGYLGYLFCNLMKFPFADFFQHICISSHINLITIIYCCICTGAHSAVIIVTSAIYVGLCTYLHFNLYNQAIKPTLLQFIVYFIFVLLLYGGAACLFYQVFINTDHSAQKSLAKSTLAHQKVRQFNQHI